MEGRAKDKEALLRRKKARRRFRLLIRMVIFNKYWLRDMEDKKLSTNVKRNISILLRQERKIGLLTMAEKALLRMPHELRSVDERKRLLTLILSLKCFHNIPPKLCARLVPYLYFVIVRKGLIIINQGSVPMTVYFILTGEIDISRKVWSTVRGTYVETVEFIAGPGDLFGDIEMIERNRRSHTVTCSSEVELLCLDEEHFTKVLRPYMTEKWNEKKEAIKQFEYFDNFNENQIVAFCKFCVLKQFKPLENIFYEDKGPLTYVHFVISGQCMILQCLKMKTRMKNGKKSFELTDIKGDDGGMFFSEKELNELDLFRQMHAGEKDAEIEEAVADSIDSMQSKATVKEEETEEVPGLEVNKKKGYEYYGVLCGLEKPKEPSVEEIEEQEKPRNSQKGRTMKKDKKAKKITTQKKKRVNITEEDYFDEEGEYYGEEFGDESEGYEEDSSGEEEEVVQEASSETRTSTKKSHDSLQTTKSVNDDMVSKVSKTSNFSTKKDADTKIENHFIDVGTLTFGGIFGLGEKFEHRVIMARTTVQCLMVPRFWLLEKPQNPGNRWQRMRLYLDTTIPSRDSLFENFLATMQWHHFKHEIIEECLQPKSIGNPTKIQDIPIICRIVEASDDVN